jgi:hypothetical protein
MTAGAGVRLLKPRQQTTWSMLVNTTPGATALGRHVQQYYSSGDQRVARQEHACSNHPPLHRRKHRDKDMIKDVETHG